MDEPTRRRRARRAADPDTSTAIERLRRTYERRLGDRIAQLEACWQRTPPDLAALEHAAHRLAGSAGSFGFTEIGRHAAALEELLTRAESAGRAPDRSAVEALLGAMRSGLP